jgi:hypothetical protein
MIQRYEALTTPDAVLAAFEAGRRVQSQTNGIWDVARYGDGNVRLMMRVGVKFRALIDEAAIPAGFTPWAGGECPEDAYSEITTVFFRDGTIGSDGSVGDDWDWSRHGGYDEIIAYRVESERPKPGGEWLAVSDERPSADDADCNSDVLFLRGDRECLGKAASRPVDATHWRPTGRDGGAAQPKPEAEKLLSVVQMIADRARNFPEFPMGYHMGELFRVIGQEPPAPPHVGETEPPDVEALAWMHRDDPDRVISAKAKAAGMRDGGASASAMEPYCIPLARRLRPQVDEAMVERASTAFITHNVNCRYVRHAAMRAALTAALNPEAISHG